MVPAWVWLLVLCGPNVAEAFRMNVLQHKPSVWSIHAHRPNFGRHNPTPRESDEETMKFQRRPEPRVEPVPSKVNSRKIYVDRILDSYKRFPLASVHAGEKFRGQIISMNENGMFVDIGSYKDGFAHVKDFSHTYFVNDLRAKYSPGQEVDVFVKFVDPEKNILSLQLFPPEERANEIRQLYRWKDLHVEQEVEGRVVKVSDFGAFVSFGGPVMGFLHRRKMLSNRRQRKLMSWEVCPVDSTQKCYIYRIQPDLQRVELTTFPPDRWELLFSDPSLVESPSPPSSSQSALRGLEDVEDEGESEEEEELSVPEIEQLTGRKLLIDDLGGGLEEEMKKRNSKHKNTDDSLDDDDEDAGGEEESPGNIFTEISEGRSMVTFSDVQTWEVLSLLLENQVLTKPEVKKLFVKAGGGKGRISIQEFEVFVRLLEKAVGDLDDEQLQHLQVLEDDDDASENHGDEAGDDVSGSSLDESTSATSLLASDMSSQTSSQSEDVAKELSKHFLRHTFQFLTRASKQKVMTLQSLQSWQWLRELRSEGRVSEEQVRELYAQQTRGDLSRPLSQTQFTDLVQQLQAALAAQRTQPQKQQRSTAFEWPVDDDQDEDLGTNSDSDVLDDRDQQQQSHEQPEQRAMTPADSWFSENEGEEDTNSDADSLTETAASAQDGEDEEKAEDGASNEQLLANVFNSLSNGKPFLRLREILAWDFVQGLVAAGAISEEQLQERVSALAPDRRGLDQQGFDQLLNELIELQDQLTPDDDDDEEYSDEGMLSTPEENTRSAAVGASAESSDKAACDDDGCMSCGGDDSFDDEDGNDEDDEEAQEIDADALFDEISRGKKYVTFEAVKRLELVQDVLKEFSVSEVYVDNLFSGMPVAQKGRLNRDEFADALEEIAFLCGGESENTENWQLD